MLGVFYKDISLLKRKMQLFLSSVQQQLNKENKKK